MRYAKWMVVVGLVALTVLGGCGAAPRPRQQDPVEAARQRYALAQAKVAEAEQAAKAPYEQREQARQGLVNELNGAKVVWTDAAEEAIKAAREARDEACSLDPSSCVVVVADPPPPALYLKITDFSVQGVRRLPGSATWKVTVELDKWLVVDLPGKSQAVIKVEDCSLPVCVFMDEHGEREAIDCPSAVQAVELFE